MTKKEKYDLDGTFRKLVVNPGTPLSRVYVRTGSNKIKLFRPEDSGDLPLKTLRGYRSLAKIVLLGINYQKREIIFSPDRSQIDIRTQTKDGKYVTLHFSWNSPEARFLGTTPSNLADVILIEKEFRVCSNLAQREFWRINKERKRRR